MHIPNQTVLKNNASRSDTNDQTEPVELAFLNQTSIQERKKMQRQKENFKHHHTSVDFYRLKLSKSKLKAVTRTSALLSGFAMVAMVELGLDYSSLADETQADEVTFDSLVDSSNLSSNFTTRQTIHDRHAKFVIPQIVLIVYALVTCLLVGVHMLALMISTCILPQIEALSLEERETQKINDHSLTIMNPTQIQNIHGNDSQLDDRFLSLNRRILDNNQRSLYHQVGNESILSDSNIMFPYIQYHRFIELAWISSTVVGIFLFLVEIALVCYIKFYPISYLAALTGAMVMTPILILFVVFTYTFYKRLAVFKVDLTKQALSQIDHNLVTSTNII